MGYMTALDLATNGIGTLEQQITIHLTGNHFPAVPVEMVGPCIAAIQFCSRGDYEDHVPLPEGITYQGEDTAPAYAIVEAHHLEPWIDNEEE